MKSFIIYFLLITSLILSADAQVPQGIPYQAVARNAQGQPLNNQTVKVRFSILDSTATGNAVYVESHTTTTSTQGLFNLNVGMGNPSTGTFSAINWGVNFKFLRVELDTTATGNNFVDLGTQQMMSVPYALYSNQSGTTINSSNSNGPSSDSSLIMTDAFSLPSGSYIVPPGEKWKIVSIYKPPGFTQDSASYTYAYCYGIFSNAVCRYYLTSNIKNLIKINSDWYTGIYTTNELDKYLDPNVNCTVCPTTIMDRSLFTFSEFPQLPIWLSSGESIETTTKLKISVEVYK
jgi:hypothetical protein